MKWNLPFSFLFSITHNWNSVRLHLIVRKTGGERQYKDGERKKTRRKLLCYRNGEGKREYKRIERGVFTELGESLFF